MLCTAFQPTDFQELPGWDIDDHCLALAAFRRNAEYSRSGKYRTGSLNIRHDSFRSAFNAALAMPDPSPVEARRFFETFFVPCRVSPPGGEKGFVTGFYEPVVEASPNRTGIYRYPVYSRPSDLVEIEIDDHLPNLPGYRFARNSGGELVEYYDRSAIEKGALDGQGLEIAWLADKVELFFIHVQGAARLQMTDGSERRITYAAKSGHPFTGPGKVLIAMGELSAGSVTMQSIKAWFKKNPGRIDEILWKNRSFIFFREAPVDNPELGPIAAAKVSLTAGRSLAVDRLLHTFSTPFYIDVPDFPITDQKPLRRLMIAQDTGSAITGAARGDIFTGSGAAAGEIAGIIKHEADFFALLPRILFEPGVP